MSSTHQDHLYAEGYSGRNPVPTIKSFKEEHAKQLDESSSDSTKVDAPPSDVELNKPLPTKPEPSPTTTYDAQKFDPNAKPANDSDDTPPRNDQASNGNHENHENHGDHEGSKTGGESKAEIKEKAQANKAKPTDNLKKVVHGERTVRDPVTGTDVVVKDAEFSRYDNDALDPAHPKPGPALNPPQPSDKTSPLHTTPNPVKATNIAFQPYPPEISTESLSPFTKALDTLGIAILAASALVWFSVAFSKGWFAFIFRTTLIGSLAIAGYSMVGLTQRKIEKELERIRMDLHRVRAEKFSPPTPESVEWLNALLKTVWHLINPDMFIPIADMVEDVMQASLPSFVDAVKISDIGQGSNPVRIISMRGLPDQPGDKEYPREEWIDLGKPPALSPDEVKKEAEKEDNSLDDQSGDYVNYEISLSYQAQPGQGGEKLRSSNIHLMLEFFLGVYDWLHIPVPIYAVVEGFAVTARLRLQLVASPPYVRNLTVTLMGVPKVSVSVVPLAKALPNVLDLPLISGFVQSAIAAAANEYVAPKSLTLNLAQMLVGDGIKKDTATVGVLMIKIGYAKGLGAQDTGGSSDPYVVLAYTKLGKPLYSSRIIKEDLNPVWEETAFLLVTADEINAEEDLSLQLWDSDKRTADDIVGRVVVTLKGLMSEPNKIHERVDHLSGFEDADAMPGEIHWSVGYFEKWPLNKKLQVTAEEASKASDVPAENKEALEPQATVADSKEEADALTTPPDPERPAGVLSVIIHHISSLQRQDLKGSTGDREGAAGQDTDDPSEQDDNLPSAYCEVVVNDDMIYKTRTKQYSTMPFYEAGTEHFVRDWRTAEVRVVVRDSKLREHDPILGIVNLPLRDVLRNASQVTGMYSLVEGVGFGRASISVLFKSFKMELPRNLSGWDTGTVHVMSDIKVEVDGDKASDFHGDQLSLSTTESSSSIPGKSSSIDGQHVTWSIDETVRLPVYNRYLSALTFQIGGGGLIRSGPEAFAALWLQDIPDDEDTPIRIPLIISKDVSKLRQNYINDVTAETHDFKRVGWLTCTVKLDSGLDADHETVFGQNEALRHNFETFEHIEGQAKQAEINSHAADDGVIDKDEQKAIDRAKKRELASRHRGPMQFGPVRTGIWMKDGVKSRMARVKNTLTGKKDRAPTVETEA